jgi:restriction endonuclease S subunit
MEMNKRLITLNTLTKHRSLRLKPSFYNFVLDKWPTNTKHWQFNYRIRDVIKSIRNGKDVSKDEYSFYETEYFYLTVNNIKPYEFSFNNKIYLAKETGEKLSNMALNKNDLIITRSGTVGISKIFNIENSDLKFIPSGYLIVLSIDDSKINPIWLEYYLNNKFIREYFDVFSSGKTQNNLSQYDILNLPIVNIDNNKFHDFFKKVEVYENKIKKLNNKIETLQSIIDEVFDKNGLSIQPDLRRDEKFQFSIEFKNVNQTPWLGCKPYLHRFLKYELKNHINNKLGNNYLDFSKYIKTLWSGEYIPKSNYSETETDFIYLKIGNVSNNEFNFDEITYLNPEIGASYLKIQLLAHDLIITRSGTVGRCVIFESNLMPDKKIIPSHHLAIIRLNSLTDALFLKYYVQSSFGADFLWALSTGKVQKEITNWSIKKLPIPIIDKKEKIVEEIQSRELKTKEAVEEIKRLRKQIDDLISEELSKRENSKSNITNAST